MERSGKCDICGDKTPDEDAGFCYDCWWFRNSSSVAGDCEEVFERAAQCLHVKPQKLLEACEKIGLDKLLGQIRRLSDAMVDHVPEAEEWDIYRNARATLRVFGVNEAEAPPPPQ